MPENLADTGFAPRGESAPQLLTWCHGMSASHAIAVALLHREASTPAGGRPGHPIRAPFLAAARSQQSQAPGHNLIESVNYSTALTSNMRRCHVTACPLTTPRGITHDYLVSCVIFSTAIRRRNW